MVKHPLHGAEARALRILPWHAQLCVRQGLRLRQHVTCTMHIFVAVRFCIDAEIEPAELQTAGEMQSRIALLTILVLLRSLREFV